MSFDSFETELKSKKPLTTGTTQPAKTGGSAFDAFESQLGAKRESFTERAPQENMAMGMLKGVVSAPATMVARPFQAAQSAWQLAGMDIKGNEAKANALSDEAYRLAVSARTAPESERAAIRARAQELNNQAMAISKKLGEDANWKPSAGGIIAEAPENFGDVKKDIGRGIQTVALGVGSPLAGGAAFGLGSSLEQGNDLFSMDTLNSTLLGMGFGVAGKVIGKPLLDVTGKVIGKITPQILKDVTSKGQAAVADFMARNKLLGGVVAPLSEKITAGAAKFDDTINKTASSLWQGTKNIAAKQYPGMTKDAYQKKWEASEVKRFTDATRSQDKAYYNSRKIIDDSGLTIDDIENTLKDTKTYGTHNTDGNRYQTMGAADEMTNATMSNGPEILRPALREAQGGAQRVTTQELRNEIAKTLNSKSYAQFSPQDKADMAKAIIKEYQIGSPNNRAFGQNGYNLEDLYNAQLKANEVVYSQSGKTGITSIADSAIAARKKIEAEVFKKFLVERAPKELGIENYLKEQQKRFVTANYLRALDGKPMPKSLWQKSMRVASKVAGAGLGVKLGGAFGVFPGMQLGSFADDMFMKAENPIKIAFLKDLQKTPAEAYEIMKNFTTKSQFDKLWMKTPRLNAPSNIDVGLQGVKNEWGAIEMPGPAMTPANTMRNDMNLNARTLYNTKQIGPADPNVIRMGDSRLGTPNQGVRYGRNPEPSIGGIRQKFSDAYDRSVAEWKASGTKQTYDNWVNKNTPLFAGSTPKKGAVVAKSSNVSNEIEQLQIEIEMLDDAIQNSRVNPRSEKVILTKKGTRKVNPLSALYDRKEGGLRELGDIRNGKVSRQFEDLMAEAGYTEPLEYINAVNQWNQQKARLKGMKSFLAQVKRNPQIIEEAPAPEVDIRPEDIPF